MRPFFLTLLAACSTQTVHEGISVGNPSLTTVMTARSPGVELDVGRVRLHGVGVRDVDGNVLRTDVREGFDLLGNDRLEIPAGEWRAVTLHFVGDIRYRGVASDGSELDLRLSVPEVRLVPEDVFIHSGTEEYVAELAFPGWLDIDEPVTDVVPGSVLHDALARSLQDASALYVDVDDDGELSAADRSERAAAGVERRSE